MRSSFGPRRCSEERLCGLRLIHAAPPASPALLRGVSTLRGANQRLSASLTDQSSSLARLLPRSVRRSALRFAVGERRSSPRASSSAGLRSSSLLRGAPLSISSLLSTRLELADSLPPRSEERSGRRRAGSRRASALRGAPRPASSLPQSPTGPSGERSGDASSRSEEREREASQRLTFGLGSSPLRTMSHL